MFRIADYLARYCLAEIMLRPEKILCYQDLNCPPTRACSNRDRGLNGEPCKAELSLVTVLSTVASARGFDFGGSTTRPEQRLRELQLPYLPRTKLYAPFQKHKIQITNYI
ncbi:hypothetical protein XPA_005248 [Xanthoria parietina]